MKKTFHRLAKIAAAIILLTALAPGRQAMAQYYTIGSDPAFVQWNKMKSAHFSIVYPNYMDSVAKVYLYNFERNRRLTNEGMGVEMVNIPIVLHPYTSLSNGTVVWAPKRVDLLSTPEFKGGYAQSWETQLSLHEARHIDQMTHYTKGFFKFLYYLMGEQSSGLGVGMYPSGWFLEGDAVQNETNFSNTGRGRDPDFLMDIKASIMEGENRSYDNWRYGSYRNYAPNKYTLGYLMHSTALYYSDNYYYPGEILKAWTHEVWNLGIYNVAFMRYSNNTARKHFRSGVKLFREYFRQDLEQRGPANYTEWLSNNPNNYYTTYHSPIALPDGKIYVVKAGYEDYSQLISIDADGNEKLLRPFAASGRVSQLKASSDHSLMWSEIIPDERWELQDNSIIREYDINTRKVRNITHGTRYYNPAVTFAGDLISVTEYPLEGGSNLVIISRKDGHKEATVRAPNNGQIKHTVWIGDNMYAGVVTDDGWGLYSINLQDISLGKGVDAWRCEIPDQTRTILNLSNYGDDIVFQTDLDGVTNLYSYSPATGAVTKLTNVPYGAFSPYYDDESRMLYYTYYDNKGYHPVRTPVDSLVNKTASMDEPYKFYFAEYFADMAASHVTPMTQEEQALLKDSIEALQPKHFSKTADFFHIHSWAPLYFSVNRIMNLSYEHYYQLAAPGATILMQNLLGTAETQIGYSYHHGFHAGHLHFVYNGLYPAFELAADYNDRNKHIIHVTEKDGIMSATVDTTRKAALELASKMYVPINLGHSGINSGLIPEIAFNYTNDVIEVAGQKIHYNMDFQYGIRYYRMLPMTKTALMPRLGIGLELRGSYAKGNLNNSGVLGYMHAYGYLPGITKQQGIKLSAEYQYQTGDGNNGSITNLAKMPRGYQSYILRDYAKISMDYALPIYIGDFQPTTLFYFMRINLIPFIDCAIDNLRSDNKVHLWSYGTSATLQGHFFRIGAELQLGVRWSRYLDVPTGLWKNNFQFITSYSL